MASKGGAVTRRAGLPSAWAESLLERMLAPADSRIISGDLREEYAEAILPHMGLVRANLWYLLQVLSFVPQSVSKQARIRTILFFFSGFTAACGCWLAFMECSLRHPGYHLRFGIDLVVALIPMLVIVVLFLHLSIRAERWLWIAAIALSVIAVQAIIRDARSVHFEGFVLLTSLAHVVQAVLMLASLGRAVDKFQRDSGGKASLNDPNNRFPF